MPFKSEKQRRYMHANLPEIAKRWERDYASGGIARLGYQQGNWVAPFYNTNVMQGSVIPPDMGTYNYQYPRGTDIIGMDEMNTYGQLPMGTDTIGMNEMFSYEKPGSIYAPYGMGPDGKPYKNPRTIGQQVYAASDPYGNKQMDLERKNFYQQPAWYNRMFNKAGQGITGLKNQMGNIFSGVKNKGGALMGNILGMAAGIPGLGMLFGNMRPDNPYEKFQKQMFAEMGYQGNPNKDPFGKNVRSLFGEYDVREQFDKLAGSKIGQKYGYEEAMKDGVLTDEELEAMKAEGLRGWQLNRFKTLFEAKKRADAYHKNIRDAVAKKEADREARKRDQANIRKIEQHTGQRMSDYRRSRPASERQFTGAAPKGTTTFDTKSGMGRRDYVQGGLASLWPK